MKGDMMRNIGGKMAGFGDPQQGQQQGQFAVPDYFKNMGMMGSAGMRAQPYANPTPSLTQYDPMDMNKPMGNINSTAGTRSSNFGRRFVNAMGNFGE